MQRFIYGLLVATLAWGTAQAGTASGTVVSFTPVTQQNGTEFFVLTLSNRSNAPACATSSRLALSATDAKYKTVVAMLLGAYFTGASVYAVGEGTCNTYGDSEDLQYVCLNGGTPC